MRKFIFSIILLLPVVTLMAMSKPTKEPTVIIMLGAPGAGKGTQAVQMSAYYNLPQISTGDLFRENLKNSTLVGQEAKAYMDAGKLVPDSVVLDMLLQRIQQEDCQKGYILDGFPRTIPQAEALDAHLNEAPLLALNLEVPDDIIVERIVNRTVCEQCGAPYDPVKAPPKIAGVCDRDGGGLIKRADDTKEIVLDRLAIFHEQTKPLKAYYQKTNRIITIDGTIGKEAIFAAIKTSLYPYIK
ncbi:MAG: adenylate kinase [Chlamydiales bacterium]